MNKPVSNLVGFKEAVSLLKGGDLCAFATDTVYGLGARLDTVEAVQALYTIKNRNTSQPVISLCADLEMVKQLVEFPPVAIRLAKFWPGGLTLVLPLLENTKSMNENHQGTNNMGVRIPGNQQACDLIKAVGCPLATTSANISGNPSPVTAQQVAEQFGTQVPILDNGKCISAMESTILAVKKNDVILLRSGVVSVRQIEQKTGISVSY